LKKIHYRCWTSRAYKYTWHETAEFVWEWCFSGCYAHAC